MDIKAFEKDSESSFFERWFDQLLEQSDEEIDNAESWINHSGLQGKTDEIVMIRKIHNALIQYKKDIENLRQINMIWERITFKTKFEDFEDFPMVNHLYFIDNELSDSEELESVMKYLNDISKANFDHILMCFDLLEQEILNTKDTEFIKKIYDYRFEYRALRSKFL